MVKKSTTVNIASLSYYTTCTSFYQCPDIFSGESDSSETRIYLHTDEVYEFEDAAALLMCRATQGLHKPAPTVIWSVNDVIITDDMPGFKVDYLIYKFNLNSYQFNL